MKNEIKLYICPKCKSAKIKHQFKLKNLFGIIPSFICNKCGHQAKIFPIAVVDAKILDKKI